MWRSEHFNCALFENGEFRLKLSFAVMKIHKKTTHWPSILTAIVKGRFIYFGSKRTARPRDLSTIAVIKSVRFV